MLSNPQVGEHIEFGHYVFANDSEPIVWRILKKQGLYALLITEYGIDCKPYNEDCIGVTWASCTLRKWLNETFLHEAFTPEEKESIIVTAINTPQNPIHSDTDPGSSTKDRVFLLSLNDVKSLFRNNAARRCAPTEYAISQGAFTRCWDSGNVTGWWWLRTPGHSQNVATDVRDGGTLGMGGAPVDCKDAMVRPAMWVDLRPLKCISQVGKDETEDTIAAQVEPIKKAKRVINTLNSNHSHNTNLDSSTLSPELDRSSTHKEEEVLIEQTEDELIF